MVVLNRIYTKTGDDGSTALGTGERRPKSDLRVAAYGTVDETNAQLGVAREALGGADTKLDRVLASIQNDLFDLGADLCAPPAENDTRLRVTDAQVERLEAAIDALNGGLAPLRSFILPGGSKAAAALHVARTVSRRAEREIVGLASLPDEHVSGPVLRYINRLSDFLFVAARHVNDRGRQDVLWVPGENRNAGEREA